METETDITGFLREMKIEFTVIGDIGDVAEFLRDLAEEKFPKCVRWDIDPRDCHCHHCRIIAYANQAEAAENAVRLEIMQMQRKIEKLSKELEDLRAIDRERVRLLDETASLRSARHPA